jgi:Ferredoxin-like protein
MIRLSLPEKLALDKFMVDEDRAHIYIDNEICKKCSVKNCLFACPAGLYTEKNGEITVEWAGCLECGTCLAVCRECALSWKYPNGGCGIIYRQG